MREPGYRDELKKLFVLKDIYDNPIEIEHIWENCSGLSVQFYYDYGETEIKNSGVK